MNTNKLVKRIFVLTLLLLCRYSYAEPNGTCWSDINNVVTFNISSFTSNKAGSTASGVVYGSTRYNVTCAPNPERLIMNYYSASLGNGIYDESALHLTDSLDVAIMINKSGTDPTTPLPFYNLLVSGGDTPPTNGGTENTTWGQNVKATFTLTKDAIGGAIVVPFGAVLYKYYGSVSPGVYASKSMVMGTTAGQIIPVETTCTINGGNTITVPFGDIEASQLKNDGPSSVIKKDISLNYSCTSSLTQDIEITLVGSTASFESTALSSSIADVGVVMMHDSTPVKPNDHFMSKLVNGTGSDTVTFAPIIRSGATNVQGNFTASATLIMTSA